jgi:hypothetical protein
MGESKIGEGSRWLFFDADPFRGPSNIDLGDPFITFEAIHTTMRSYRPKSPT